MRTNSLYITINKKCIKVNKNVDLFSETVLLRLCLDLSHWQKQTLLTNVFLQCHDINFLLIKLLYEINVTFAIVLLFL